jgi:hypothetical protein
MAALANQTVEADMSQRPSACPKHSVPEIHAEMLPQASRVIYRGRCYLHRRHSSLGRISPINFERRQVT